jgi:threonine aldolase
MAHPPEPQKQHRPPATIMHKYSFLYDYAEGAHPQILEAFIRTNLQQELGYGKDSFCEEAAQILRQRIGNPNADIHFVTAGTQANLIVLSAFLRPFESVIAPASSHIHVHEAGGLESLGHKINLVPGTDGKLTPADIERIVAEHSDEHTVKPRVVALAQSTELGTIYTKSELSDIAAFCKAHELYLYADGARLGSALTCAEADMDIAEFSRMVDAFYIGGTKNGALLGEALVINNPRFKEDFRYHLKQRGALLAKGRVLGIQFLELFKGDLYFDLARHANEMAHKLAEGVGAQGYAFLTNSPTNQRFPILPNAAIERLRASYGFHVWAKVDPEHSAIRLVTSWATPESAIEAFLADLKRC